MKIKDRKYFVDIKTETMTDTTSYSHPMKKSYQPLDLSVRCDSVDTYKTLSPYSTGSGSPPMETSPDKNNHDRSATYSDHSLQESSYPPFLKDFTNTYPCQKRDSPSPDQLYYTKQHNQPTCNIAPYMLQAAALQQRLSQHTPPAEDDSSETLNKQMGNSYPYQMIVGRDGKLSRPFKAYPRDPFSMASLSLVNSQSAEKFEMFRMKMLKHIHAANGGQPTVSNPKMRRTSSRAESTSNLDIETITNNNNSDSSTSGVKDSAYYERRKKNNAAAKKSRDRRRIKEDEIAIRATFLENENRELQAELISSRNQITEMKMEIATLHKKMAMQGAGQ
ncbi:protein giant isoform X1 [Bradysia coprophila]|uniref:protein giant isoform X1 n=2 Tax=Bradysia coprophila TaxID=38358 RepID=UPI00187DD51E|nr:protein giant isoform X1 [Bradysia coprophila]